MAGLIFAGMGAGLGQGLATMGASMLKDADRLEELELKLQARRDEKLAELQSKRELQELVIASRQSSGGSGGGGSGDPIKTVAAEYLKGQLSKGPTDRSGFETEIAPSTEVDELNNPMPTTKVFDKEGYGKAERERVERDVGLINRVKDPSAWDDVQKGSLGEIINGKIKAAMEETDPKKRDLLYQDIGAAVIAAKGDDRFKVQGDTEVDVARGEVRDTNLGRAKQDAQRARASESAAEARKDDRTDPNARKGGGSSGASREAPSGDSKLKSYEAHLGRLERRLKGQTGKDREDTLAEIRLVEAERDRVRSSGRVDVDTTTIPAGAISFLKANPDKARDFDAKYGLGASKKFLSK